MEEGAADFSRRLLKLKDAQITQPHDINDYKQRLVQLKQRLVLLLPHLFNAHQVERLVVHVQRRIELPKVLDDGGHQDGGCRVRRRQVEAALVGDHRQNCEN